MGLRGQGGPFHSCLFAQIERLHPSKGLGGTLQGEECFPRLFLFQSLHEESAISPPSQVHISLKSSDTGMLSIHGLIIPSRDTQCLCPSKFPKTKPTSHPSQQTQDSHFKSPLPPRRVLSSDLNLLLFAEVTLAY